MRLTNVTLMMPFQSVILINGSVQVRDSLFMGEPYHLRVNGSSVFERTRIQNHTFFGVVVETMAASFEQMTFDCGGDSGGTIHLRVPLSFRNNTLREECLVAYELQPILTDMTIEFAFNIHRDIAGGTQLTINDALHVGHVIFDIHHLDVIGGGWTVQAGAVSPNTSIFIHDSRIFGASLTTIRIDGYDGVLRLWNLTFDSVFRAARFNGLVNGTRVATADNITVVGNSNGLLVGDGTWLVTNSHMGGVSPQYETEANGHILIYDTADTAFAASLSSGSSVEHFAFLNVQELTWQGGIPIVGDVVSFRNAAGNTGLNITPGTWSPSDIVWWGMYSTGPNIDNRDLRPYIAQGARTFGCLPSQFYVSVPMAPIVVTCTDDSAPAIGVASPASGSFLNAANFTLRGALTDAGAGLVSLEWSPDNVSFVLLASPTNASFNWTLPRVSLADGPYMFYMRSTDRVGNVGRTAHGPITVDTTFPTLGLVGVPPVTNRTSLNFGGAAEPFSNVTLRFLSGWIGTTTVAANGSFVIAAPVHEGVNTFSILVVDRAGNSILQFFAIDVDTMAPAVTVMLNGRDEASVAVPASALAVSGSCEPGSSVRINGTPVVHTDFTFDTTITLASGFNGLMVECTDLAGNTGSWHGGATFDNAPPALTFAPDGVLPTASGAYIVKSQVVALFGHAFDNNSGIDVFTVNGIAHPVAADGSITLPAALDEGHNSLHVVVVDRAGNTAALTLDIWRDTTRPTMTAVWEADASPILEVGGFFVTRGAAAKLRLNLSEAATVQIPGRILELLAGETVVDITLADGQNRVAVDFNDTAGNRGIGVVMAITRDSEAPTVTVETPTASSQLNQPFVQVSGKVEPGATVKVQGMVASVTAAGDFELTVPLVEGSNTITIEAQDIVGNRANTTVTVTVAPATGATAPTTGSGLEYALLGVGLAAGAAVAFVVGKGRRRPPTGAQPAGPQPDPEQP